MSYLNDGKRSKKFLNQIGEEMGKDAVFLDLNGSSVLGLAAASMGAKEVYILENTNMHIGILEDYIKENSLTNVKVIPEASDEILGAVTNVISDPNFSSAILPWENLKMAYILYKFKDKLREGVSVIPEGCEFWAMPVEFQDLHKIRIPLGTCEGIDMGVFDKLVEVIEVDFLGFTNFYILPNVIRLTGFAILFRHLFVFFSELSHNQRRGGGGAALVGIPVQVPRGAAQTARNQL